MQSFIPPVEIPSPSSSIDHEIEFLGSATSSSGRVSSGRTSTGSYIIPQKGRVLDHHQSNNPVVYIKMLTSAIKGMLNQLQILTIRLPQMIHDRDTAFMFINVYFSTLNRAFNSLLLAGDNYLRKLTLEEWHHVEKILDNFKVHVTNMYIEETTYQNFDTYDKFMKDSKDLIRYIIRCLMSRNNLKSSHFPGVFEAEMSRRTTARRSARKSTRKTSRRRTTKSVKRSRKARK
jgi:hypothetical protein